MHKWAVSLALLCGLAVSSAHADETFSNPREVASESSLMKFLLSPEVLNDLGQMGSKWDRDRGFACDAKSFRIIPEKQLLEIFQPIVMPADKAEPTKGLWSLRFTLDRCGGVMKFRILMDANSPKVRVFRVIPGESGFTSPTIQKIEKDLKPIVLEAVKQPDCSNAMVVDSYKPKVVDAEKTGFNGAKGRHLQERWWAMACGKRVALDIDVFPNPDAPGLAHSITVVSAPGPYIER